MLWQSRRWWQMRKSARAGIKSHGSGRVAARLHVFFAERPRLCCQSIMLLPPWPMPGIVARSPAACSEQFPLAEERVQGVGGQVVPTAAAIVSLRALQQRIEDDKVRWRLVDWLHAEAVIKQALV